MTLDTITSQALAPLLAVARSESEALVADVRVAAGLPDELSLDVQIPVDSYFSAWEHLGRLDGAVLRAVHCTSLADLEIFGFLAMTARSLDHAFSRIAAVRAIWATGAGWTLTRAASTVRLTYMPWRSSRPGNTLATHYAVADMVRSVREIVGQTIVPTGVGLTELPASIQPLEDFFGVRPVASSQDFVELPASIGELPVVKFDTRLHAFFERECDALALRVGGTDWLTEVRRRLAEQHAQDVPSAAGLARSLGMSERSLRRRFAEHETTFTSVRQEVATELANAYLRRGLSASETGFALGYAEPSAFFRAYKGWTGRTPGEYAAASKL